MKESVIEGYLRSQVKKIGGVTLKLLPNYVAGIPDRLVLHNGKALFVELKRPGEKPRRLQVLKMQELEAKGFETRLVDSKEQVDELINYLRK